MANLERIVNVQIALNTAGISKLGFSTMLVAGVHAHTLNRVDIFTTVDEMIELGFSETDPIYLAVKAGFSQIPRPRLIKVGKINPSVAKVSIKTVSATGVYTVVVSHKDINGNVVNTPYTYTNSSGDATAILNGINALITADTNAKVTGAVASSVLTLTPKTAGENLKYSVVTETMTLTTDTFTETITEAMTAIKAEDNDFYGIILANREQANILAMASWVETQTKLFLCSTSEAGAIDNSVTTDTAYKLKADNYFRTSYWYHAEASTEYIDSAVMARCFAINPGGENWALKSLASVSTDNLSETQFNALKVKNGNSFENVRNITVTQNGKVSAGEWIDVIRFRDWLQEEMATNVFTALKNSNKIAYTDAGIAIIEAQVKKALDDGVASGGIAPVEYDADGNRNESYVITVPKASDITSTVKATRVLSGVEFTARLAGAINVVNINGALTYDNLISVGV